MNNSFEQEPRLLSVLGFVSSESEFDLVFSNKDLRICFQRQQAFRRLIGQATKGSRRIPWHTEAMKDVVTCDKSRGAGSTL